MMIGVSGFMDELQREQRFLRIMQNLVKQAKTQGNAVSEEEIEASFADLTLTDEQLQQIRDYLAANKIGIGEPIPLEELLTEEEHDYLKDYTESLSAIEQPSDSVLDAIKISAMAGDPEAQQHLCELLLPKVVDVAKLYAGQGVFLEDLIGIGNEQLVRGVTMLAPLEGPEEVEGVLARQMMDAMEDLIAQNLDEKAQDEDVLQKVNKVAEKARALAEDLGRKVTVDELAGEGDVTKEQILDAIRFSGNKIEDLDYRQE
jgi:RNA polymerase primary sigma factor